MVIFLIDHSPDSKIFNCRSKPLHMVQIYQIANTNQYIKACDEAIIFLPTITVSLSGIEVHNYMTVYVQLERGLGIALTLSSTYVLIYVPHFIHTEVETKHNVCAISTPPLH